MQKLSHQAIKNVKQHTVTVTHMLFHTAKIIQINETNKFRLKVLVVIE